MIEIPLKRLQHRHLAIKGFMGIYNWLSAHAMAVSKLTYGPRANDVIRPR